MFEKTEITDRLFKLIEENYIVKYNLASYSLGVLTYQEALEGIVLQMHEKLINVSFYTDIKPKFNPFTTNEKEKESSENN